MSQLLTWAVDAHTKTKKFNKSSKLLKTSRGHPFLFYKGKYKGKILKKIFYLFLFPMIAINEKFFKKGNTEINTNNLIPILQYFVTVI